jgi:hypothetical protein
MRVFCAFCGDTILRSKNDVERQLAAQAHITMCRLHPMHDARLHVENLVNVVEVLQKGFDDPRLAPMPTITHEVTKNARAWLRGPG